MTTDHIELTTTGAKLPYRRFLTDAAIGLIALIWIDYAFGLHQQLKANVPAGQVSAESIGLLIAAAVLVAPLGTFVSCLSFIVASPPLFLAEWLCMALLARWRIVRFSLLFPLERLYLLGDSLAYYRISSTNYFRISSELEFKVSSLPTELGGRAVHTEGLVIFHRNLAVISIFAAIFAIDFKMRLVFITMTLVCFIISFVMLLVARSMIFFACRLSSNGGTPAESPQRA